MTDNSEIPSDLPTVKQLLDAAPNAGFKSGQLTILPQLLQLNRSRPAHKSMLALHVGLERLRQAQEFDRNFVGPVKVQNPVEEMIRNAIVEQFQQGNTGLEMTSARTAAATYPNSRR